MATILLNTRSHELQMTTDIHIIIPDMDVSNINIKDRKVLYLLHGFSDNSSMWIRKTRIETYAEKTGIIVVMPNCHNSFYINDFNGANYENYVVYELRNYLHETLGLSLEKDKNFIAGLSMGGGGAMRIALKHSDKYFAVGSFSGTLLYTNKMINLFPKEMVNKYQAFKKYLPDIEHSEINCASLLKDDIPLNVIYISCGMKDGLYFPNLEFDKIAKTKKLNFISHYNENYSHEWEFWDQEINNFLSVALK